MPEVGTEVGKPKPRRLTDLAHTGPQACASVWSQCVGGKGCRGQGIGCGPCGQRESGSGTSGATGGWKGPVLPAVVDFLVVVRVLVATVE